MEATKTNPSIGIAAAAALSGLSIYMITYLGRIEILTPSGGKGPKRGRRRQFTFNDVIFLRVIHDLLARGIEVKQLGAALRRAQQDTETWIDIRKAPRSYLVTDGTEVFIRRHGALESKTTVGQLAFWFVLDLGKVHDDVTSAWPHSHIDAA